MDQLTANPRVLRLVLLFAIATFIIVLFWPSYDSIVALWNTSDHRHGILVFPIAAFLVWRQRGEIAQTEIGVDFRAMLILLPLLAGWAIARLGGIQVVEHFAALALIPAAVWAFLGAGLVWKLLFPLLFPLFSTPVTDALVPSLMVLTADISTALLQLSGMPVYREGQYISLPGGEFVVADVCSGVRYLVTGVMIATLYGYLTYESLRKRLILVAVTAAALILANGVRAYTVMAVASMTNMQYLAGRDHIYFGWVLFGIVMMFIMWIGTRYAEFDDEEGAPDEQHHVAEMAPSAIPLIGALGLVMLAVTVKPLQADFGPLTALLVVVGALLVFVVLVARHRHATRVSREARPPSRAHGWQQGVSGVVCVLLLLWTPRYVDAVEKGAPHTVMPVTFDTLIDCQAAGTWAAPWKPLFVNADASDARAYSCSGGLVNVYSASYGSARQGSELINSINEPVPAGWDRITAKSEISVEFEDGWRSVNEVRFDAPAYKAVAWYWYEVDGRTTTEGIGTKMSQLVALAEGRPAGGRVVLIETPLSAEDRAARERLKLVAGSIIGRPEP